VTVTVSAAVIGDGDDGATAAIGLATALDGMIARTTRERNGHGQAQDPDRG
jgi:hypothetical protein